MLPEGFKWRKYMDGRALYLAGKQIADITPLRNGRFRCCMHPSNLALRYEFFDSERACVLYIEAWAEKWEVRLRNH